MKKTIYFLVVAASLLLQYCQTDPEVLEQVQLLEEELDVARNTIDSLEAQSGTDGTGFIHTVFFWFEDGVTEEQKAGFIEALRTLREVETVRDFYIGPPAGTPRDVVDNSYDYALVIHFEDKAGQNAYQTDPIHLAFVESQEDVWERVQVYDTLVR